MSGQEVNLSDTHGGEVERNKGSAVSESRKVFPRGVVTKQMGVMIFVDLRFRPRD